MAWNYKNIEKQQDDKLYLRNPKRQNQTFGIFFILFFFRFLQKYPKVENGEGVSDINEL